MYLLFELITFYLANRQDKLIEVSINRFKIILKMTLHLCPSKQLNFYDHFAINTKMLITLWSIEMPLFKNSNFWWKMLSFLIVVYIIHRYSIYNLHFMPVIVLLQLVFFLNHYHNNYNAVLHFLYRLLANAKALDFSFYLTNHYTFLIR